MAETAASLVLEWDWRAQGGSKLLQELINLILIRELWIPSWHHHLDSPFPPSESFLSLSLVPAVVGPWPGLQLHCHFEGIGFCINLGCLTCWREGDGRCRGGWLLWLKLGQTMDIQGGHVVTVLVLSFRKALRLLRGWEEGHRFLGRWQGKKNVKLKSQTLF